MITLKDSVAAGVSKKDAESGLRMLKPTEASVNGMRKLENEIMKNEEASAKGMRQLNDQESPKDTPETSADGMRKLNNQESPEETPGKNIYFVYEYMDIKILGIIISFSLTK